MKFNSYLTPFLKLLAEGILIALANSIFLPLRATSVIFWRFTPKPEFQKKIALLTEI